MDENNREPEMDKEQIPDAKESALVVLGQWRERDKEALADKRDHAAQRGEYKMRNRLRNAADNLKGGQP